MTETNSEAEQWTRIHPALDFTADHCYIGQKMRSIRENNYFVVTDQGFVIPALPEENLEHLHLELTHQPYLRSEIRWTAESINRFSRLKRFPTGVPIATGKEKLLTDIRAQFCNYIEFADKRCYTLFTLWAIGTYYFPLFNTYPYVHLIGLMKSGKSKLFSLCSCLSFNGFHSTHMTPACLFRLIEEARSSLFIDEAENLSTISNSEEIRSILLGGYRKGGLVFRAERDRDGNFVPRGYEVYGPKMVANIEGLEEVLSSRCITVTMQRSSDKNILNTEVNIADPSWQQIRDSIYPFVMINWKEILRIYAEFQNDDIDINGRELELWKPMLALANFFGNDVF